MFDLKKINDSKEFYEDRYAKGYMETWSNAKKMRVRNIIESLDLPNEGEALDFGCGNGVFTEILKKTLPDWKIYGCDISETSIKNASKRNADIYFFVNGDKAYKDKQFDFIFTHHVLEHVFDIKEMAEQITNRMKNKSSMLHILPCGNPESFERRLCDLRIDGIDSQMENRFFFEDEGHIRRMTTDSCEQLFKEFGFILERQCYSNQYYGAVDWISGSHPLFILKMFNPMKGKNINAKVKLSFLLVKFVIISVLRLPCLFYENNKKSFLIKLLFLLPAFLSKYINTYITYKAEQEWKIFKMRRNGSEMWLYFKRNNQKNDQV